MLRFVMIESPSCSFSSSTVPAKIRLRNRKGFNIARRRRLFYPGKPQHLIQRGNNRQVCFADEQDMLTFGHWLCDFRRIRRGHSFMGVHDQPYTSPRYAYWPGRHWLNDAGAGTALCPLFQQPPPPYRNIVGWPLSVLPSRL